MIRTVTTEDRTVRIVHLESDTDLAEIQTLFVLPRMLRHTPLGLSITAGDFTYIEPYGYYMVSDGPCIYFQSDEYLYNHNIFPDEREHARR